MLRGNDKLRGLAREHATIMKNAKDFRYFSEFMKDMETWRYPRVSFDTFLDDPRYLGIGGLVYPEVRRIGREIIEGDFKEAVVVAGIGGGKTLLSNLLSLYKTHELLCYRNPHRHFSLIRDKPITLMNMGTTATQALEVGFAGVRSNIERSPWFQRFSPHILASNIRFLEHQILLVAGNSKATTPLGYNVFNATLDEAAFYLDNDKKQVAGEIYNSLQKRITSRFPGEGLLVMISSPQYVGDFVMQKLEEARKMPDLIYSAQMPTWKLKPVTPDLEYFYFNARKGEMLDVEPTHLGKVSKITEVFDQQKEVWEIPTHYQKAFIQDPDKAMRDFAAVPSKAVQAFMPHYEMIKTMFTEEESPAQASGKYTFPEAPLRANYYIHIDLALNKKGSGDHAGLAMCHFGGWEENEITGERHKTVIVDLAERISAGPTGEIEFSDVRNKIYALKKMGYNIKTVTLDSYQCLRRGTKILTIESDVKSVYNKGSINNRLDMSLQQSSKIPLLTGVEKNIEELKKDDYVYSLAKDKSIKAGRVKSVWCSGKKDIYRVWVSKHKYIDCSGNHPFMLRNGNYARADTLQEGASLMPLYRIKEKKGYEKTFNPKTNSYIQTHRLVMGVKGRSKIVHHKDENKLNNNPPNLEIMRNSDHCKHHWTEERRRVTSEQRKISNKITKPRLGTTTSQKGRKNISAAGKKIWQDPKHIAKMMLRETAHHGKEHPMYDKSLTIELLQQYTDKKLVQVCKILKTTPRKVRNRIRAHGYRTWNEFKNSLINHKVLKVEKLNIQDETWDIEIEGLHNFAVGAGVFVHNSTDSMQLLRSKGIRSDYLSVDRTIEPYQTLKEIIYTGRIKCHKMEVLLEELCRLEITKSNKVDHSPGSSKDVADAVCGAVFGCVQDAGGEAGLISVNPAPDKRSAAVVAKESKENYYKQLHDLQNDGLL